MGFETKYKVGEAVEVYISGYDFGLPPLWVRAEISRSQTPKRVWVKIRLRGGREIERALAYDNVRKLNGS